MRRCKIHSRPRASSRASTHKSRLFGNRWLMSALPPEADIDQTIVDVRFVPILLRNSFWVANENS